MLALLGHNIGIVRMRLRCREDMVLVRLLAVRMRCRCQGVVSVLLEHDIGVIRMQC